MRHILILGGLAILALLVTQGGSRPIVVRNGSGDEIAVWMDKNGCGLESDFHADGHIGKRVHPGGRIVAPDTEYFDSPSVKVIVIREGRIARVYQQQVGIVLPLVGRRYSWKWTGTELAED